VNDKHGVNMSVSPVKIIDTTKLPIEAQGLKQRFSKFDVCSITTPLSTTSPVSMLICTSRINIHPRNNPLALLLMAAAVTIIIKTLLVQIFHSGWPSGPTRKSVVVHGNSVSTLCASAKVMMINMITNDSA